MKTLIINPLAVAGVGFVREGRCEQRLSSYQYVLLPVSLPSIAAVLRQNGFKVKIIDAVAENLEWPKLKERINSFKPNFIVLNVSTVTFNNDMLVAKKIKKLMPNVHISALGVHVTTLPEEALSYDIDSAMRGEPEATALELAKAIQRKQNFKNILGISYKKNNQIFHNPPRPFIENLNELPFPARDLVKNEKYLMAGTVKPNTPHTVLLSSRGCTENCIFCTARQYYGQKLRIRNAKNIVDEMEEIKNKYKINYITMWSDTFTLDRKFVIDLCKEILKRKLKINWMCNSRVDTIDEKMLKAMKKAGCIGIAFGVESGVQKILDKAGKKTTLKQIENAFKLMKKVGIESLAHFIFGLPGETPKTTKETIKFAKKLDPDYAQFYCAVPFPGTPLYTLAKKNNWLTTDKWENFEINRAIIKTPLLSQKDLERSRKWAYISFYFRPNYIFKRLKKVKSIKDLKFMTLSALKFIKDWGIK